jgi:hypothetical protein
MANEVLSAKDRTKKILEEKRKKDIKPVTGIFRWYESPGGTLRFPYGSEYKEDGIIHYVLEDEKSYTLPRMVAEHLNSRSIPVHKHRIDEKGKRHQDIGRMKQRMAFIPTDFMDIRTLNEIESGGKSPIVNVTR